MNFFKIFGFIGSMEPEPKEIFSAPQHWKISTYTYFIYKACVAAGDGWAG
jgi:hypothetical protein